MSDNAVKSKTQSPHTQSPHTPSRHNMTALAILTAALLFSGTTMVAAQEGGCAGCDKGSKKGTAQAGDSTGRIVAESAGKKADRFAKLDANGDGLLTPAEAPKLFEKNAALDADGNGGISRQELGELERTRGEKGHRGGKIDRKRIQKRFANLDADKNGTISASEWQGRSEAFAKIDKNSDGQLTLRELASHKRGGAKRGAGKKEGGGHFAKVDTDGDGKISAAEFKGDTARFERMDKNNDGFLTKDEIKRPRRGQRGEHRQRGQRGERAEGGQQSEAGEQRQRGQRRQRGARLREMDTNKDGSISRDEWQGKAERFDKMDRNGDGVLNKEDRPRHKRPHGKRKDAGDRKVL